jgi:hypothetical protein
MADSSGSFAAKTPLEAAVPKPMLFESDLKAHPLAPSAGLVSLGRTS